MKSYKIFIYVFIGLFFQILWACTSSDIDLNGPDKGSDTRLPLAINVKLPLMSDGMTRDYPTTFYQPIDSICDSMQIAFVACGLNGDTTYYGNGNNYCVYTFDSIRQMWIPDDPIVIGTQTACLYPYYPYFIKLAYHYDFSHNHHTGGPSVIDSIRAKMFMPVKFNRVDGIYRQVDYMYGRHVPATATDPYFNNDIIQTSVTASGTGGYANVDVTMLHAQAAIFICLSIPRAYFSNNTKVGRVHEVKIGDVDRVTPGTYTGINKIFVCGDLHFDIMNGMITRLDSFPTLTWTYDTLPKKWENMATWQEDTIVYSTFIVPKVKANGDFNGWTPTSGIVGGSSLDPDIRISVEVDGKTYVSPKLKNNEWLPGRKYYYYVALSNALTTNEVVAPLTVTPFATGASYGDRSGPGGDSNGIYAEY